MIIYFPFSMIRLAHYLSSEQFSMFAMLSMLRIIVEERVKVHRTTYIVNEFSCNVTNDLEFIPAHHFKIKSYGDLCSLRKIMIY